MRQFSQTGGMIHWLFNKMVICDIGRYLEKQLG